MHTACITALLQAGSNPQLRDGTGQDVVHLLERLRRTMPLALPIINTRLRLEEVSNCVTGEQYDACLRKGRLNHVLMG